MKPITPYLLLLAIVSSLSQAFSIQAEGREKFTINGRVNQKIGTVRLIPVVKATHTRELFQLNQGECLVVNGQFQFSGHLLTPCAFYLEYFVNNECRYVSAFFVVDRGHQQLTIDVSKINPVMANQTMQTFYATDYFKQLKRIQKDTHWFERYTDSLQTHYKRKLPDSLAKVITGIKVNLVDRQTAMIWSMCSELKTSFYALWSFYDQLETQEFKPEYEYIFQEIAKPLRQSKLGEAVSDQLNTASTTGVGKFFPANTYLNLANNRFEPIPSTSRYTLIEFWWSGCGVCLAHIPTLRDLYRRYSPSGFSIIGISTDQTASLRNLERALKKHHFEWSEYLDENRVRAQRMGIFSYPTYLLVDSTHHIVYKKISFREGGLKDIDAYLHKHLN